MGVAGTFFRYRCGGTQYRAIMETTPQKQVPKDLPEKVQLTKNSSNTINR
jgi:hypothetical protein